MSLGSIINGPWSRSVKLLHAAAATNSPPRNSARSTLTFTDQPEAAETVTIGATVYTFVAALSEDSGDAVPYEVLIAGTAEGSRDNLTVAINAGSGEGTAYGTGTVAHPDVTATSSGTDAIHVDDAVGSAIATTTDVADASWSAATLVSPGVDLSEWLGDFRPESASLIARSTAGSGTMTTTLRLHQYSDAAACWVPAGPGAATTKGTLNDGAAIAESEADKILHSEPLDLPTHARRFYVEVTDIGGTSTAIDVWATYGIPYKAGSRGRGR